MSFLNEGNLAHKNGMSATVSTKDWLKFICLSFLSIIPLIGPFVYLGMLIYLAINDGTAESVKSYIKASFIFMGIGIIISLILIIGIIMLIRSPFLMIAPVF